MLTLPVPDQRKCINKRHASTCHSNMSIMRYHSSPNRADDGWSHLHQIIYVNISSQGFTNPVHYHWRGKAQSGQRNKYPQRFVNWYPPKITARKLASNRRISHFVDIRGCYVIHNSKIRFFARIIFGMGFLPAILPDPPQQGIILISPVCGALVAGKLSFCLHLVSPAPQGRGAGIARVEVTNFVSFTRPEHFLSTFLPKY